MQEALSPLLLRVTQPPMACSSLPKVKGVIRCRPEDFRVEELPQYAPDGSVGAHFMLTMTKTGMNTEDALRIVSRALDVPRPEVGLAGLKDRHAVTTQWITVPASAESALSGFHHDCITLGQAFPHGNKLRRGHLAGNRFRIVVRDLCCSQEEALQRIEARLDCLREEGGLRNYYGPQRFGYGAANVSRGLRLLNAPQRIRKGDLMLSAAQSAVFNLTLANRVEQGLMTTVLRGDVLRRRESGGAFICDDPTVDQQRFDAGELGLTAPLPGSKMLNPPADSPAGEQEERAMAELGVRSEQWRSLGKKAQGSRRDLLLSLAEMKLSVGVESATDALSAGTGARVHSACRSLRHGLADRAVGHLRRNGSP